MSPSLEKLQATLRDLEQELATVDSLDADSRRLLEQAAADIRAKLGARESTEEATLIGQVQDAARRFETTHPTLSGILERIAEGLAQLGI